MYSAHSAWAAISDIADVVIPQATTRADFLEECRSGAFEGISVAFRTFDSVAVTGNVDAELISVLPASLRFICHNGAGYDQVDVTACTARNIRVSNTPTAVDDATADINMFLILGARYVLHHVRLGLFSSSSRIWRICSLTPILDSMLPQHW